MPFYFIKIFLLCHIYLSKELLIKIYSNPRSNICTAGILRHIHTPGESVAGVLLGRDFTFLGRNPNHPNRIIVNDFSVAVEGSESGRIIFLQIIGCGDERICIRSKCQYLLSKVFLKRSGLELLQENLFMGLEIGLMIQGLGRVSISHFV